MVPEPLAGRLQRARACFGDPCAEVIPPHITLIPPTAVPQADLPGLADRIGALSAQFPGFSVRLRGVDTFRPVSPVVFAKVAEGFEQCQALAARLRSVVTDLEERFPYHPHVTLAQDAPEPSLNRAQYALDSLDETFTVGTVEVCLLESDAVWHSCRQFPLAASQTKAPSPITVAANHLEPA
jgi:2'-5' RNA ligase